LSPPTLSIDAIYACRGLVSVSWGWAGETYVYYAVEEWRYQELMQADSKGTYLNVNIKPNYQYAKL
jgi:hypothetical protein